ncbi:hypothetical protein QVD99_001412 [Batrachochytrium dendrobatidis]|nr:hypothetical protein QVD99_001412 [Batrachochytrium dendrobatidis]
MKLSITILSSILAVCSVTVANPVDPSSTMNAEASASTTSTEASTYTMSAEVSTPTASTSGGSTGEPDYSNFPEPYNKLGRYCYPLGLHQMMLIEITARNYARVKKVSGGIKLLIDKIDLQKKLIEELKQQAETQGQASSGWLDTAKSELETQQKVLDGFEESMKNLFEKIEDLTKKYKDSEKELKQHLGLDPSVDDEDDLQLESIPGYEECFDYFYNRPLQRLT